MRLLALAALTIAASACGAPGDVSGGPPEGSFLLVSGTGLVLTDTHPVTLDVDGDEVGGIAACNRYGGEVAFDGETMTVSGVSATEMGCIPIEVMDLEQAYLSRLVEVDSWAVEGETLVLTGPGFELIFEATTG